MTNKSYWAVLEETQEFRKSVKEESIKISKELSEGFLLPHETSEKLAREYAYNIGYLEGLKYLQQYVQSSENSDGYEESQTLSRSNDY